MFQVLFLIAPCRVQFRNSTGFAIVYLFQYHRTTAALNVGDMPCRPPLLGFKYMQPPIAINMRGHVGTVSDESALPTASTCFNLLKLPPYQDEQTMLQKLLLAIEGAHTFDLS